MNRLIDVNAQQKNLEEKHHERQRATMQNNAGFDIQAKLELQRNACHNMLKIFKCPQCGLTFDRASQLDYHYRSIHLKERPQVCEVCGKGFFRKADLRTHLNIHLGTNFCICEICGRKFSHISNLIRHCRMHAGVKPYPCSICDKRFTQISSLARHKRKIHGRSKEMCQYAEPNLTSNELQAGDYALKENEYIRNVISNQQSIVKHQCYCKSCGESFGCLALLRQHEKCHVENTVLSECNSYKKTLTNIAEQKYDSTQFKCQHIDRKPNVQKNEIISNQHNTDTESKVLTLCLPLETVVYVTSEHVEKNNAVEIENTNPLPRDHLGIEEKLGSTDTLINKIIPSYPTQDTINNHEMQSTDNIIYLHQFDTNSFTFLSQEERSNTELENHNNEDILRLSNSATKLTQDCNDPSSKDTEKSLDTETNLQTYNSNEAPINNEFLHNQTCAGIVNENRECNKTLNDDDNQLYMDLSDLSELLKFDESRYRNNTNSVNLDHTIKSQNSTCIATNNDVIHTCIATQNRDNMLHNEDNVNNINNLNNIGLNNEEPMLRLVQTETGEQFYEFIISNLVDKMQNVSCTNDLENKMESPSILENSQTIDPTPKENNENNDQTEYQQALEDLTDISNEFNYTQFDFQRAEDRNFSVLSHNESGHFQQNSKDNECVNNIQEKDMQIYNSGNLELLENESHVDFEKYVATNLEVFERLNDENCNEKFLEFVEIADIGIESSRDKEPSMVCLIQNDGEQLLELIGLQDSQIAEQESNQDLIQTNNLDEHYSNALQNNKIADCLENKSDFFTCMKDNMLVQNINIDKSTENNEGHTDSNKHTYMNLMTNENVSKEDCGKTLPRKRETKKPKTSPKRFQCSVCNKIFSTAYNYKQHIGMHFTDQKKFHCKECGMSFAWKSTLNKHITNNHNLDGPQRFACEICPKVYSSMSQVNEHVKRDHLKQRDHICRYCGKSFFKSFDLKMHSRMHTDERPYACRACGKRFHHHSHMIRHERSHTGDRPYVCNICQNTFTQLGSLKAHKQKHQRFGMGILDYQINENDLTDDSIK